MNSFQPCRYLIVFAVGCPGTAPRLTHGADNNESHLIRQPTHPTRRGRAYTLHPHLTHLADDPTRGLLQFGVGRPLGDRGFRWLLVQVGRDQA